MPNELSFEAPGVEEPEGRFYYQLRFIIFTSFTLSERCGRHGNGPNVDSVEILQPGTATEESSQVDDAETCSVDPPVIHPTALIGATVLRDPLSLGHLHGDLGEVLHDEDETKEGENY